MKRRGRAANGWSFFRPSRRRPRGCSKRFWRTQGRVTRQAAAGPAGRCRYPRGRRRFRRLFLRYGSSRGSLRGCVIAMQPRLLMTAAMAFFSIALTLNMAGVRLTTLAAGRPAAAGGALVHGTATEHGFGADRAVLRPFAVCVRSGIESAGAARPGEGEDNGRAAQGDATGDAGPDTNRIRGRIRKPGTRQNPSRTLGKGRAGPAAGAGQSAA